MAIKGQGRLFDPSKVNLLDAAPSSKAVEGAKQFTGGKWSSEGLDNTMARGGSGHAMFRTYSKNQGNGPTGAAMRSYESMRGHLSAQFDFMTRPQEQGGLGIEVNVTKDDPYPSFEALHKDVTENNRLNVMSTETTGGHSFFTNEENDQFRAVHDYFGHVATGRGFDRHGEEAAYRSHAQMFPKDARQALASETRGQNSYLNWGGGEFPGNAVVEVPEWMSGTGDPEVPKPKKTDKPQGVQGKLFG